MKTKYLLTAMALPLMVACTQDEVVSQDNNQVATLENRVNAGKIAFANGEEESRFDFFNAKFEKGDKFRLFLMDDENGYAYAEDPECQFENMNANTTWFMEQGVWNKMYTIDNNFDTNIPFVYNGTNAWENDDAIVEGNYFAVLPSQGLQQTTLDKVKNRRDVWVYINPVQKFDVSKLTDNNKIMIDGIETNQFFLGYSQVYRNEQMVDENNTLQLPIQLRPVMANIDLAIKNVAEEDFKVEKIVISRLDGSPMPTIAYVRPAGNTPEDFGMRQDDGDKYYAAQWAKMANAKNIDRFVNRYGFEAEGTLSWQTNGSYIEGWNWNDNLYPAPAFAQPYIIDSYKDKCGNALADYYWTIDSWTRTAARSVVEYSYPGQDGLTPYGCTGELAKPAYEYILDFTDAKGEGVILKTKENFRAFFALPHDMYMREYTFTVYGQQYDSARDRWNEGIIFPKAQDTKDWAVEVNNEGIFTLPNLDPSSEADYLQANIYFEDFGVGRSRIIQTSNADELMNHLESYYGKVEDGFAQEVNKNEIFYVETMGEFEITNELVDYVQALYNRYTINGGSKSLIYFTRTTGADGHGHLIFPEGLKNQNAIDLFYYSKQVDIINRGTQIINKPIIYNYNLSIEELRKALEATEWGKSFANDGIDLLDKYELAAADVLYGGVGHITNEGTLTINTMVETAPDAYGIYNAEDATLNMKNAVIFSGIKLNAVENVEVETYVHNAGELNMTASTIDGRLDNCGITNIKAGTSYICSLINKNDCVGCVTANAVVNIEKGAKLDLYYADASQNGVRGVINNYGTFNANGLVNITTVNNYGKINGLLVNNGTVNNGDKDNSSVTGTIDLINNFGTINAYYGIITRLTQFEQEDCDGNKVWGTLYVYNVENEVQTTADSEGKIYILGVAAQHIGKGGNDIRYYVDNANGEDAKLSALMTKIHQTEAYNIIIRNTTDITFDIAHLKTLAIFGKDYVHTLVESIMIERSKVNFIGEGDLQNFVFGSTKTNGEGLSATYESRTELYVLKNCELHIENMMDVYVQEVVTDAPYTGTIHTATNCKLMTWCGKTCHSNNYHEYADVIHE